MVRVMNNEFTIFQLVDSAFPTGAFSHSFGLETAIKEEKINGPSELYNWVKTYISGNLAPSEGSAVFITYQAIKSGLKNHDIQRLDQKLTISKASSESRNGGIKIGKRYLKMVNTLYPESGLEDYAKWISQEWCYGNASIVHGWISAYLGVSLHSAIFTHLYASVNNLLQSAVRLTAVGQTDVQLIMQKLYPLMEEEAKQIIAFSPGEEDLFTYSVMQEMEAMRHESLYSRLFMS